MKTSLSLFVLFLLPLPGLCADIAQGNLALQQGRVGDAEITLRAVLASAPRDAFAHQLLCRVFYAQDQPDPAIAECEAAVVAAPNDSDSELWLGRAYGQKAQRANPFTAYVLAKKVRIAFERAVQVKPTNIAAMSDLGEFYVAAPAILGGGLEKAQRVASALQSQSPAKAHRLLAYIANSKRDSSTAEVEFKNAVAAGMTPSSYVDLGMFYQDHGKPDQAVLALTAAIHADVAHDAALADAAGILAATGRAPEVAERALRDYLKSPAQSEEAPTFKVHLQLGKLLAHRGDLPAARREYAAAVALAPNFEPARDALKGA